MVAAVGECCDNHGFSCVKGLKLSSQEFTKPKAHSGQQSGHTAPQRAVADARVGVELEGRAAARLEAICGHYLAALCSGEMCREEILLSRLREAIGTGDASGLQHVASSAAAYVALDRKLYRLPFQIE